MKKYYPLLLLLSGFFFNFSFPFSTATEASFVCNVYVPNAFSPNDDGRNDQFLPYPNCAIGDYNMKVFNRWGKLVFETDSIDKGWDGKVKGELMQPDVFVYIITFTYAEDDQQKEEILSGDVSLVR